MRYLSARTADDYTETVGLFRDCRTTLRASTDSIMSSSTNGRPGNHRDPTRRLRHDDLASVIAQTYAPRPGRPATGDDADRLSPWLPRSHSGRRFVIMAGLAVLLIWGVALSGLPRMAGALSRACRLRGEPGRPGDRPDGRDRSRPTSNPASWRDAVSQTRAMLLTVTGVELARHRRDAGLRDELDQAVGRARAHPETAVAELAGVWNAIADRAEFLLKDSRSRSGDRHPRPAILPPPEPAEVFADRAAFCGLRGSRAMVLRYRGPRAAAGRAPSLAERVGQGDEFLDVERLGAELAAESLRLEPGVNVGLGPLVAPEPGQDVADVLAAVEEDLAHQPVEPGDVADPARRAASGRTATTAESTLGRGQKTDGGSPRTIDTSASAWTTTETAP